MSSADSGSSSEIAASALNVETKMNQYALARQLYCEQTAREQLMAALTETGRSQEKFSEFVAEVEQEYRQAPLSKVQAHYEELSSQLLSLIRTASAIESNQSNWEQDLTELLTKIDELRKESDLLGASEPRLTVQELEMQLKLLKQTKRVREIHLDTLQAKKLFQDTIRYMNGGEIDDMGGKHLARQQRLQLEAQSMERYPALLNMLDS